MSTKMRRMILAGSLAMVAWLGLDTSMAKAQGYGYGYGRVHRHGPGCGHAGYATAYRGGYSYGSSYYSQGRYTRPFGFSTYGGYAPGRGAYFGNSYYSRGYSSSSYFGYSR